MRPFIRLLTLLASCCLWQITPEPLRANEDEGPCLGGYSLTARQSSGQSYDPNEVTRTILRINLQPESANLARSCANLPITIVPQAGSTFTFTSDAGTLGFIQINSRLVSQANATRFVLNSNARSQIVRGQSVDIDLFEINQGQFPVAGEYQGTLLVQVGDNLPTPVLFAIRVRPAIRFVPENGSLSRQLTFGEVTAGATIRSAVLYQSNAGVSISIQSQNKGNLAHENGPSLGMIAYRLNYDGSLVDLSSSAQINRTASGLGVRRDEMILTIDPVKGRFGGIYRDVLIMNYTAF